MAQVNIQDKVKAHQAKATSMPAQEQMVQGVDPKTAQDRAIGITNTGSICYPNGGDMR